MPLRRAGRGPIAKQRLELLPDGRVSYHMKRPDPDGRSHLVCIPVDVLRHLASITTVVALRVMLETDLRSATRQLAQRLSQMSARSARALTLRCFDGKTKRECAVELGIAANEWPLLYFDAALELVQAKEPPDEAERLLLADRLQRASEVVLAGGGRFFLARDKDDPPPTPDDPPLADQASRDPRIAPLVAQLRLLAEHRTEVLRLRHTMAAPKELSSKPWWKIW